MTEDRRVSEDEARRLWARAAELQAEVLARRDAAALGGGGRAGETGETGEAGEAGDACETGWAGEAGLESASGGVAAGGAQVMRPGYDLAQVREAALEVGISQEFIDRAVIEAEAGAAVQRRGSDGIVDAYIGEGPLWLEAEGTIERPPDGAFAALRQVANHLDLALVDSWGKDPKNGGVLVFERSGVDALMRHKVLQDLYNAAITELHVSLQSLGEGVGSEGPRGEGALGERQFDDRCRLRIRAPMLRYRRVMAWSGIAVNSVVAGGIGLAAAIFAPGALATVTGGLIGAAIGVPAAAASFAAETYLWRWMRGWGERTGQRGLESLIRMIATNARTDGAFNLPSATKGTGLDDVDQLLDGLL